MKADAALFGALLCILIAGTLTRAKTITEPGNQSRTYSSTEGTTVTTGTRLPITHFTTETSKGTTETPVKTTTTAASITIVTTTTHRQPTSESPQTITHLTTERTTLKTTTTKAPTTTPTTKAPTTTPTTTTPKTTTPKTTTPTTTTPKTTKTTTPTTTTPKTTKTTTPTTTTPTTTTTTIPTTATAVQSTVITPGVVTNHNGNPTTEQTGGSVFPVWPQTTTTTTTTTSPSTSSTTPKPTTSHSSGSTSSSHTTVTTTTTTHHSLTTSKTTTTTIPPTPTLPPNPTPPAKWWNVVYDSNGTNCMMIRFAAQIEVTYVTVDNRTVMAGFDIPANASVNSDLSMCNKAGSSEVFALNFTSHSVADGYLVAIFKKNAKTNASSLFELMVSYPITKELFPGISPKYLDKVILLTSTNLTQFETDPLHCYTCNSRLALNFTSIAVKDVHFDDLPPEFRPTDPSAHIFKQSAFVTRHLKIQTFLPTKKNMDIFMPGKLCEGDKPDTLWTVDFIVAVVMGALVALTLIIYYGVKKYKARNAPSEDILPIVEE